MSTSDGGPAFPSTKTVTAVCPDSGRVQETYIVPHGGMTLRDYFAANAIAAIVARTNPAGVFGGDVLCAEPINPGGVPVNAEGDTSSYEMFLRWGPVTAYAIADAMIAARNGGGA